MVRSHVHAILRFKRLLALFSGVLVAFACFGSWSRAAVDLSPSWAVQSDLCRAPNSSFLIDFQTTEHIPRSDLERWSQGWIDPGAARAYRSRWENLMDSYEARARHDQLLPQDRAAYNAQMSGMGAEVIEDFKTREINQNTRKLENSVKDNKVVRKVEKPVGVLFAAAAIYNGRSIGFDVGRSHVEARAVGRNQLLELKANSPWGYGQFEFLGTMPRDRDPFGAPVDPSAAGEWVRVSVSRGLPIWDLGAAASYGATTSQLTTSLVKPLTPRLSCAYDRSRFLKYGRPDLANGEDVVRMNYGFQF